MKDFGVILIYSFALLFAVRFFWKWFNGGFNTIAIMEWANRGFAFGIGLAMAFFIVLLAIRLVAEYGA